VSKRFVATVTLGLGAPAFVLSRVIWPDPPGAVRPPASLLPFLIVPAVMECLAFGVGIAFLVAAGRALPSSPRSRRLDIAACASAGWALISWWPHSNLHRVNTSFQRLVMIDWFFHLSLIAAAVVVALFISRTVMETNPVTGTSAGSRVSVGGRT
jgi:hypothetical protein